jgi:hypothetical protein
MDKKEQNRQEKQTAVKDKLRQQQRLPDCFEKG